MTRLLAALVLVLTACSSAASPTTTSTTTTSTATTTTTTTTSTTTSTSTTTTTTIPAPPPLAEIEIATEPVADGFTQPIFVTTRDDDDRLYIIDQDGIVWALSGTERTVVLDITGPVRFSGEQGLLGLAFHPNQPERMIVHYTDTDGDTMIAEYAFPLDAAAADPEPIRTILTVDQPAANHNGGMIAFGPDGYFYVALGDGGGGGDTYGNGQDRFTLLGDILRLDIDGDAPYAIPPDNPYADGARGAPEVWVSGLRNPWRFSFDGDDLWIGDVGQGDYEEVDLITVDDGGMNLGWPIFEGTHCFRGIGAQCTEPLLFTPPIHEYDHGTGRCSITGGYVYRGARFPELFGVYLFADYCSGEIMGLRIDADGVIETRVFDVVLPGLTSFGKDGAGEIYVTTAGGRVDRVIVAP